MESRRNGPQLSSRHDDDDGTLFQHPKRQASFNTVNLIKNTIHAVQGISICISLYFSVIFSKVLCDIFTIAWINCLQIRASVVSRTHDVCPL